MSETSATSSSGTPAARSLDDVPQPAAKVVRDEGPADVVERVQAYADGLANSDIPKLFVDAEPGSCLVGAQREIAPGWPDQSVVRVPGNHFLQEDSHVEIGAAVAALPS